MGSPLVAAHFYKGNESNKILNLNINTIFCLPYFTKLD